MLDHATGAAVVGLATLEPGAEPRGLPTGNPAALAARRGEPAGRGRRGVLPAALRPGRRVNQQELYFDEVRTIIATAEKAPVRMAEAMSQTMGIQWHRGTQWALDQARAFRDEVRDRAERKLWILPNERYRMMYVGSFLSQALDFFSEFEASHGVMFVRSNYLSIGVDGYLRFGTRDPLRTLAGRYATIAQQMHLPPWSGAWALWEARRHRVDGALMLSGFIGRTAVTRVLEENGIPTLLFRTDAVDAKKWDRERLREDVTRFIEERLAPAARHRDA